MKKLLPILLIFSFLEISCKNINGNKQLSTLDSSSDIILSEKQAKDSPAKTSLIIYSKPDSVQPHTTLDSLQGTWISGEDKGDHVVIHGHHYDESNAGDTLKSEFYLADTCVNTRNLLDTTRQSGSYFMMYDESYPEDGLCYYIHSVDGEYLELDYVTGGKMLNFYKAKSLNKKK